MKIFTIVLFLLIFNIFHSSSEFTELKEIKRIVLEETPDVIINNINGVSFNSDSSLFIVSDYYTGNVVPIYDNNGKLIKHYKPNIYLTDTVIKKGKYTDSNYVIATLDMVYMNSDYQVDSIDYISNIINTYNYSLFFDDTTIYILAKIRAYVINKEELNRPKKNIIIAQFPAFIKINIKTDDINVFLIDKHQLFWCQTFGFFYYKENNLFLCCTQTNIDLLKSNMRKYCISGFDLNGHFVNDFYELPEEYIKSGLNYSIASNSDIIKNKNNELIGIFPYSERIHNFSNNSSININDLPKTNNDVFNKFIKKELRIENLKDSLLFYFPNRISNIELLKNGNYLVTIFCHYWKIPEDYVQNGYNIVREYTPEGKLINDIKIKAVNDDGVIKYITYTSKEDALMVFRFSDEKGWTVIYSKFE